MRCGLCGFLIIKPQTTLHHAVWCGAMRLCHFTDDFGGVFTVWWTPLFHVWLDCHTCKKNLLKGSLAFFQTIGVQEFSPRVTTEWWPTSLKLSNSPPLNFTPLTPQLYHKGTVFNTSGQYSRFVLIKFHIAIKDDDNFKTEVSMWNWHTFFFNNKLILNNFFFFWYDSY